MPRTFGTSPSTDSRQHRGPDARRCSTGPPPSAEVSPPRTPWCRSKRIAAAVWGGLGLASCAPQDAVVGVVHFRGAAGREAAAVGGGGGAGPSEGGTSRGGESAANFQDGGAAAAVGRAGYGGAAGATSTDFETHFTANAGIWIERVELPGGAVDFGQESSDASSGNVLVLRFPGNDEAGPYDNVGPDYVTQVQTQQRFGFGTFRTRVRFGTCDPDEEVASALLGYFGDGADRNGNQITDELEIIWQVLCGTPQLSYLTVFTDYQVDGRGNEVFRKFTRAIDFSSGDVYETPSASDDTLVLTGNDPALRYPGFSAPQTFCELGFEWHSDSIRFFIVLDGVERTAWTLDDPDRIPQEPLHFMYNLWHPESHWEPASGAADFPVEDVLLTVDWLRISAAG